jgi:hypothetical protein
MVTNSTRVGSLRRWFSIMSRSHEHHAKAQTGGLELPLACYGAAPI